MTNINNYLEYANEYDFVVARLIDGEYWFYGAYETGAEAERCAMDVHGEVFSR